MSECHCFTGRSSQAIACSSHIDHPHDPSDLKRCIEYRKRNRISVADLRERMAGRSPQWDALLPIWTLLEVTIEDEVSFRSDGCAPETYCLMRKALSEASECQR